MWTLPKDHRPHSSHYKPTKPPTPSLKDKFKIYASELSRKGSQPTSEENRRLPVKAYTMRLSSRYRGGQAIPVSPNEFEQKDRSSKNTTPVADLLIKNRENSSGKLLLNFVVNDNEDLLGTQRKESLLVKTSRKSSRMISSKSAKDVTKDMTPRRDARELGSKTPKPSRALDTADARTFSGKNEELFVNKDLGEMMADYRKSIADCMEMYVENYIQSDEENDKVVADLKPVKKSVSEGRKEHRPQTACVRNVPRNTPMLADTTIMQNVVDTKILLQSLLIPQKIVLKEKNPVNFGNISKRSFVEDPELNKEGSVGKEMKMSVVKEDKYKQLRDNLKAESFSRIQRYNVSTRGKLMASGTPIAETKEKRAVTSDNKFRISNYNFRGNDDGVSNGITGTYKIEKVIGQGSYAVVRLVIEKETGLSFAMKSYNKVKLCDVTRKESVKREIEILESMCHPNIIKLHKTIDTPTQLHLVMDIGGSYSLHAYMKSRPQKRLQEHDAKHIFKQLAEGLSYIHLSGVAHRDLKPENILLDSEKNVKIIDFGFGIVTTRGKPLNVFCGTPSYMSPELVQRKNYYGYQVDVWALGIILFWLLTGDFPFKGPTNNELFSNISKGQYKLPDFLSLDAKNLIRKMLRLNPHERPSAKEIVNDKWISGGDPSENNLKDFLTSKIQEYKNLQQPCQEAE